ncbi:hypothetical protein SLS60_010310 [Paraconiothyrium brasiliense]|uniref:Uncharacterized protein n=1 Tax=Paraconiothyrium brasiliense TaxID=300254 RepID=A0ABR3QQX4_9PLEO
MNADQGPALEFFDAATTVEVEEKRPSMFYAVLPTMVQDRIPTLPSIRRALSHMRMEDEDLFQEALSENLASATSTPPPFTVSEIRTGIKWKYANQGVSLSAQAYAESQCSRLDDTSTILTRQMYIHSLTYLLRGLPSTLSAEETISLQAALPPNLVIATPCDHDLSFSHPDASTSPPSDPSILHRIIATIVFETFVLLQFLLPYMKLFLGHAYRFERKHNVAQRLVNSGIMGADAVRRTGLQLTHTICQMNDGKVGLALNDLTFWCVRGITGGLQQGIQEGVGLLGQGPAMEEERPRTPGRPGSARGRSAKGKR